MLKHVWGDIKKKLYKVRSFFIAKASHWLLNMIIRTCRVHVSGAEEFCKLATQDKCLLMLWHNRLALAPFILFRYTPGHIRYAALVSASRDGDILTNIIHSYRNGSTIPVPHLGRYQALQNIIRHINERKQVVVITPDGPRGPCYEIKPGIAVAALETRAHVAALDWKASSYWELRTWDRFRIPKPFSTIYVTFTFAFLNFDSSIQPSLSEVQLRLADCLSAGGGVFSGPEAEPNK